MKKILIVGFACLSLIAAAQTNGTGAATSKNTKTTAGRDAASGQASGRQAPSGKSADRESSAPSVSEVTVTKPAATGRESSQPSVSEATVKAPTSGQTHVATGDVNGDGMPDVAKSNGSSSGSGQNAAINTSHSNIKNGREAASGQASGKRQHEPLQIKKEIDKASPKL